ncbi:hypothetical protein M2447_002649 [Ereboglobus sp. PH5-10]|uniref:TrbI/VirB10 family protein n=1 Tax=Ereboglobus sp. PH5-10 TaxID=2940629 RepID=UPI0024049B3E|nr:TrbI/VirB10 family protein [Ereboglobus sp. PH5-10]MDF9828525.1 hypothetical protein [Ereboglobus sp. PH5-10]
MKRIIKFVKTPVGSLTCLAVLIAICAMLVHGNDSRSQRPNITQPPAATAPMERHTITRGGQELKVPSPSRPAQTAHSRAPADDEAETISRPRAARGEQSAAKTNEPAPLPISLLPSDVATARAADLSKNYAPYGRLIPCETVTTLESSKIDTPIIGLVTEDVWHDGRLIIPAGAEVHGRAANDHARERIAASGQWIIIWRDRTTNNGNELVINGIALDRQRDDITGEFGLRDGSAGLVGDILKTDDWQEIKLFASTFLAGMAGGLQEMRDQTTAYGDVTQVPKATAKNAALQGTADVLNAYAARIQQIIAQDGYYVRVPAGKQFYLYVTQTLDQSKATRGNLRADLWQKKETATP